MFFCLFSVIGCKGYDGDDGKVYIRCIWTYDVESLDLSNILITGTNPYFFFFKKNYELDPGRTETIYWTSDSIKYSYLFTVPDAQKGEKALNDRYVITPNGDKGLNTYITVKISEDIFTELNITYATNSTAIIIEDSIPSED